MIAVHRTPEFDKAIAAIRDEEAAARIAARIERLALGNPGDVKEVGHGVSELRINYGPGYRVYFTMIGKSMVLLLTCGSKKTQNQDIKTAKKLKELYT